MHCFAPAGLLVLCCERSRHLGRPRFGLGAGRRGRGGFGFGHSGTAQLMQPPNKAACQFPLNLSDQVAGVGAQLVYS